MLGQLLTSQQDAMDGWKMEVKERDESEENEYEDEGRRDVMER